MPTYTSALLPSTSGLALGSSALRWTAYLQDVDIAGSITNNGSAISSAGTAITFWAPNGTVASNATVVAANVVRLAHFFLPVTVSFTTIGITNISADASNSYSFGVFSLNGAVRYAHTTAQAMVGSGTFRALAVAEGTVVLSPGDYLFAWTGAATTASFNTLSSGAATRLTPSSSSTTTTLGVMPAAPISVPALSPVQAAVGIISFILYT